MPVPDFSPGEVLTAAAMDSIGLWLVKTQTIGTAVSSVTVTDAFSANYERYLITVERCQGSSTGDLRLQLGATTAGYNGFIMYGITSGASLFGINQSAAANFGYVGSLASGGKTTSHITLVSPFTADRTYLSCPYIGATTGNAFGNYQAMLDNTTSYTAFTLIPGAGTLTGGTIRVYGYRN